MISCPKFCEKKTARGIRAVFVQYSGLQTLPTFGIIYRTQKEGNDMRKLTPLFFKASGLRAYRFYFPF